MIGRLYLPLKVLHLSTVVISVALFALRGGLMLAGSATLGSRFLRIAPHVVDSLLLASAVLLTLIVHHYPLVDSWLTAKVLALVVYVVLASVALRYGRSRAVRAAALVAALGAVAYIIGTALHHDPDPRRW